MKNRILADWDMQRWIRLAFAAIFLYAGVADGEPMAYAAAVFFGAQAVFNVGCCGVRPCKAPTPTHTAPTSNVTYEEVH